MARFDRVIPPGGEGKIVLRVKTRGYSGEVYKSALVYSNDPDNEAITLAMKALVKASIAVAPRYVFLYGKEGQRISRSVKIKAGLNRPLELTPIGFTLDGKVTYKLKEIEKGKRFEIVFQVVEGSESPFHGVLRLKTNYPEKAVITIPIRGRFIKKKG